MKVKKTTQQKRGFSSDLIAENAKLLQGECCLEIDTLRWKTGDGVHRWNDLDYDLSFYSLDILHPNAVPHPKVGATKLWVGEHATISNANYFEWSLLIASFDSSEITFDSDTHTFDETVT